MKYVHDQHNALRGRRIGNAHPRVATTLGVGGVWKFNCQLPTTLYTY
jgi:hypothetical protein